MKELSVYNVFTPSSPATECFVERTNLNRRLVDALKTPGKQIVLFGHSGSGKSTLLINKLNQTYEGYIITRCTSDISFDKLLLDAFDQFGQFITSEQNSKVSSTKSFGLSSTQDYLAIKNVINSNLNISKTSEENIKQVPIVPFQLTPQKLARFFGEKKFCWVIEDFHKIQENEKLRLSHLMKVFVDESITSPEAKIIVLGAVGSSKEVIQNDAELNNRLVTINVPLMDEVELIKIIEKGEGLLNIKIHENVKNKIAHFSSGLASVAHQLCLTLCTNNAIYSNNHKIKTLDLDDFKSSLECYLENNSENLKVKFEKAISVAIQKSNSLSKEVLKCFLVSKKNSMTKDDIVKVLKQLKIQYHIEILEEKLLDLSDKGTLNILEYNADNDSYMFNDPFFKVYCYCNIEIDEIKKTNQLHLFNINETESNSKKKQKEEKLKNLKFISFVLQNWTEIDF